jgi:hypothetical protein
MRERKAIQIAAALVIVGAVAAMVVTEHGGFAAAFNPAAPRAAGGELARQALSLVKPGGQITVITRDTQDFQNPASDCLLEGFEKELRRARAAPGAIQRLQVDPLRVMGVPSGDFQNWLHQAAAGDVIVSFMGPPLFTPEEVRRLGEHPPAVVAFCPGNWLDRVDLRSLFSEGLLQVALVARRDQTRATLDSGNFNKNYAVVTQANVDDFLATAATPLASQSP